MLPFLIVHDTPIRTELLFVQTTSTAAVKDRAGGGVHGQRKQISRLHEISEVTAADTEVNQAKDIGNKNDCKHDIEYAVPAFVAAGLIFLCSERGVESLVLRVCECSDSGRVIPVMNERCSL